MVPRACARCGRARRGERRGDKVEESGRRSAGGDEPSSPTREVLFEPIRAILTRTRKRLAPDWATSTTASSGSRSPHPLTREPGAFPGVFQSTRTAALTQPCAPPSPPSLPLVVAVHPTRPHPQHYLARRRRNLRSRSLAHVSPSRSHEQCEPSLTHCPCPLLSHLSSVLPRLVPTRALSSFLLAHPNPPAQHARLALFQALDPRRPAQGQEGRHARRLQRSVRRRGQHHQQPGPSSLPWPLLRRAPVSAPSCRRAREAVRGLEPAQLDHDLDAR